MNITHNFNYFINNTNNSQIGTALDKFENNITII